MKLLPKKCGGGVSVKKGIRRLLFAAGISLACFAATHFWYQSTSQSNTDHGDQKPVAYVDRTKDEIHRRPVTRIIWQLINDGEPLYPGEAIRTSSDGEVRIQFAESSRFIDLEPDSLIVISQSNNNEIALDLVDGSLMVNQGTSSGTNENQGPALTLKSGQSKVDLSQATAALSKSGGNIDLQVLKGKAKVESNGQTKEIETGKSGAVGEKGIQFSSAELKILSPSLDKPFYMNPEAPQPVQFSWKGFPEKSVISLMAGTQRKNLKPITETTDEKLSHKFNSGKYFWKLVAKDPTTQKIIGESSLYRLEVATRFAPALIIPQAEEKILKPKPQATTEFRWVIPEEAKGVYLEVAKDSQIKNKVVSKNFFKEDSFQQTLDDGEYFIRISATYEGIEKPIASKIQKFYLSSKPFDPPVMIGWKNPVEAGPQFYLQQPTAELSWISEQKNQVAKWRLKVADNESDLETPKAISFTTPDLNFKPILEKPGRYIAMVEALNKNEEVISKSPLKNFEVAPLPLLPAPQFTPQAGDLSANNQGRLDLTWTTIEGAKEYELTLFDKSGNEIRTSKFTKNNTALVNLLPGNYQISVAAIDRHGRTGQKETPRKVQVPETSGLSAPKLKKIKVN